MKRLFVMHIHKPSSELAKYSEARGTISFGQAIVGGIGSFSFFSGI